MGDIGLHVGSTPINNRSSAAPRRRHWWNQIIRKNNTFTFIRRSVTSVSYWISTWFLPWIFTTISFRMMSCEVQ